THLPDITLVAPVSVSEARTETGNRTTTRRYSTSLRGPGGRSHTRPDFYVASRAHHADVGGAYPGSMGLCREIYQEGLRIPPVKIMRAGKMQSDILALLLNNVRTPQEREGDLGAQIAACHTGMQRLEEICSCYGLERAKKAARLLLDYSEQMMLAFLNQVPSGTYEAEDFLDNDGISAKAVQIAVRLSFGRRSSGRTWRRSGKGRRPVSTGAVTVDFTGSDPQG